MSEHVLVVAGVGRGGAANADPPYANRCDGQAADPQDWAVWRRPSPAGQRPMSLLMIDFMTSDVPP